MANKAEDNEWEAMKVQALLDYWKDLSRWHWRRVGLCRAK